MDGLLLAADARAFTLSVNGFRNYPFRRVRRPRRRPSGRHDGRPLPRRGGRGAPPLVRRARPELCFVLAGADPFEGDRLGRLALTKAGLVARDALIRDTMVEAGIPICVTLAGGYAEDIRDTVEIN